MNTTLILLFLVLFILPLITANALAYGDETGSYVIITTKDIVTHSSKLDAFIQHKQNLGYSVSIVTEEDYEQVNGQPPNGRAEKIRQWLMTHYLDMHIKYVLLIGNPDPDDPFDSQDTVGDIPMKMCMAHWDIHQPIYSRIFMLLFDDEYPTDYFYADLTGNWDFDGDGIYGEQLDDFVYGAGKGVNLTPEVLVGRIPTYHNTYSELDHILQKTIDYETDTSDATWRTHVLLPISFAKASYDYAALGEQIVNGVLIPHHFSYWRMYQQGSAYRFLNSIYPSEEELRGDMVKKRWQNEHYGIVCWMGHGNTTTTVIGTRYMTDGILFSSDDCPYLDDSHPAFTFQISCDNGHPEASNNLGYRLLQQGAIATVSSSRPCSFLPQEHEPEDFIESCSSGGIAYDYLNHLVGGYSAGEALYLGKMSPVPTDRFTLIGNIYCFNLYGDPSLHLLQ